MGAVQNLYATEKTFTVLSVYVSFFVEFFFFQAEDGIRDHCVTGVQTCALPIWRRACAASRAGEQIASRGSGIHAAPPEPWRLQALPVRTERSARRCRDNRRLALRRVLRGQNTADSPKNKIELRHCFPPSQPSRSDNCRRKER